MISRTNLYNNCDDIHDVLAYRLDKKLTLFARLERNVHKKINGSLAVGKVQYSVVYQLLAKKEFIIKPTLNLAHTHTHTHARTHARTHAHTHTHTQTTHTKLLIFW